MPAAYPSIPHLPGSRTGPADRTLSPSRARLLLEGPVGPGDVVIVEEKLDGSCVAAARDGDEIVALGRQGTLAAASPNEARRLFATWVEARRSQLLAALAPGSGSWGSGWRWRTAPGMRWPTSLSSRST